MASDDQAPDRLLALLPALLRELAASNVVELEVTAGEARLYLRQRQGDGAPAPAWQQARPDAADEVADETAGEAGLVAIMAPLAGVFYAAPAPNEPAYVQEGEEVASAQVVGLIEAMKVFNEIHAEVGGTVAKVLVATGQHVQNGTALMRLRPLPGAPPEPA
jgi:biotin carboxyl carrier protein